MEDKQKPVFKLLAEAGDAIMEVYHSNDFKAKLKSDNTPVTIADKTSSAIINDGLKQLFPRIQIIDEENKIPVYEERKLWPGFFLIDPLDGTKEFINRNGEFCINLARIDGTSPVEGWIYHPVNKIGWYCKKGLGIFQFDSTGKTTEVTRTENKNKKIRIVTSRSFF